MLHEGYEGAEVTNKSVDLTVMGRVWMEVCRWYHGTRMCLNTNPL